MQWIYLDNSSIALLGHGFFFFYHILGRWEVDFLSDVRQKHLHTQSLIEKLYFFRWPGTKWAFHLLLIVIRDVEENSMRNKVANCTLDAYWYDWDFLQLMIKFKPKVTEWSKWELICHLLVLFSWNERTIFKLLGTLISYVSFQFLVNNN